MRQYWFISEKNKQLEKFALFTFLFAFVVILLGAYTRLTDAGLSCPDWPNCFGYLTAPHTASQLQEAQKFFPGIPVNVKKAWTEMTHRYFAGTEGILIFILACSILFAQIKQWKPNFIALSLIVLLCLQVALGMLTVTAQLKPIIVLMHLITGLSILSLLWWAYLHFNAESRPMPLSIQTFKPFFWIGFFIVAIQITLGGWVGTHHAGLACVDFPYCNGRILPDMQWHELNTNLITIHMMHRLGALITGIYLGLLGIALCFHHFFRPFGILLLLLIALQIALGILNIIWLRPVWIAMLHHTTAILLLLTLMTCLVKVSFKR